MFFVWTRILIINKIKAITVSLKENNSLLWIMDYWKVFAKSWKTWKLNKWHWDEILKENRKQV